MKEILLTQGKIAIVDDEDFEWLSQWEWYCGNGYAVRHDPKNHDKRLWMHREILKTKDEMSGDHINHNKLDNRRINLRNCTHSENMRNQIKRINNSSGYKGVHFSKSTNKWMARITIKYFRKYLGLFSTPEAAARAYDSESSRLHGKYANPNF
jgi:hypothetical protein